MFLKYNFCFKNNQHVNKVSIQDGDLHVQTHNNNVFSMEKLQNNDNDDEFFWFNKMLNLSS